MTLKDDYKRGEFMMSNPTKINCTECGGDIDIQDKDLKSIICPYCGVVIELQIDEEPKWNLINLRSRKGNGCRGCH